MKTKSLYLGALLVIGAAVTAIAKEEPATGMAVVATKGSQVVKVIYKGENAGKVKLSIYDAASQIVYSESRNSVDGFILPLNFSALQSGEYTIELSDAAGTKSEKINYQPYGATKNVHVSRLAANGKFLLSVTKAENVDVTVRIFDGYNNLVHSSTKQVSGDHAELFSITNFSGACTFEVTAGAETTVVRF